MGAYLSEPVTDKVSTDESGERVICGASSMQGWRVSQEDAHNCIIDFDKDTSFFAVYDGHGGHEVALYCSRKLPEFLKNTQAYKDGNLKEALRDAFVQFDATIATPEVVAVLKELAGSKEKDEKETDGGERGEAESSDEEPHEDVNNLYEEASMPLEQVIEKYQNQQQTNLNNDYKSPMSPYLKSRQTKSHDGAGSSGSGSGSSSKVKARKSEEVNEVNDAESSSEVKETGDQIETKSTTDSIQKMEEDSNQDVKDSKITLMESESVEKDAIVTNGESESNVTSTTECPEHVQDKSIEEKPSPKGKGKSIKKPLPKRASRSTKKLPFENENMQAIYNAILTGSVEDDSDESDDEHDDTFRADEVMKSSSDEDENEEGSDWVDEETSELDSDEENGNCIEDEDEEEDDDDIHMNTTEEPGFDSGCTAVVALLRNNELYVANAGDSRCIVSRNGQVIEMSYDHKPENEEENSRIIKAGGKVTADGRVNGGLNLSRAIGDHAYKQNKDLPPEEQMITALPDINVLTIDPSQDEFMVLACDGIWNFMSNEEVVEFVGSRLKEGRLKISEICEEMFDHCLAPNTMGDGTGCDNMTAIIVQFKKNNENGKRSASPLDNTQKRMKLDMNEENVDDDEEKNKKATESTTESQAETTTENL